jgi:hypothetical protein
LVLRRVPVLGVWLYAVAASRSMWCCTRGGGRRVGCCSRRFGILIVGRCWQRALCGVECGAIPRKHTARVLEGS